MVFFNSQQARPPQLAHTSQTCRSCASKLDISRTCHEVFMYCPNCKQQFAIDPFIPTMDEDMENFLESMYADRI